MDGTGPHPAPPRVIATGENSKSPAPALVGCAGWRRRRRRRRAEGSGAGFWAESRVESGTQRLWFGAE